MERLVEKVKIEGTITLLTGLHIGGNSDNVEIGGIDNQVIKLANKGGQPYIPGSSLKGKLRSLLEQSRGITNPGGVEKLPVDLHVRDLFGYASGKDSGENNSKPSRIIVRDAYLNDESVEKLKNNPNLDMPYVEIKTENGINRVNGRANPRKQERVPAGAVFNVEFIINKWRDDENPEINDNKEIELLKEGIRLLNNDYLGGSGSRGYGQVKIDLSPVKVYSAANDWNEI